MKLTHLISAAAVVMGVAVGGAAFQHSSAKSPEPVKPVSTTTNAGDTSDDAEPPTVIGGVQFEWAPCDPPAVLEGDECVTHETHTVVVPPPPAPASNNGGEGQGGGGGGDDHADDNDGGDDDSDADEYDDDGGEDHEDESDEPEDPEDD